MALQNAFNAVKSKALGVAEYMTPVLKVLTREGSPIQSRA